MPCRRVVVPGLGRAIVCTRGRRCRCCKAPATLLCDGPRPQRKTCDQPICAACAIQIERDRHLCPRCDDLARSLRESS